MPMLLEIFMSPPRWAYTFCLQVLLANIRRQAFMGKLRLTFWSMECDSRRYLMYLGPSTTWYSHFFTRPSGSFFNDAKFAITRSLDKMHPETNMRNSFMQFTSSPARVPMDLFSFTGEIFHSLLVLMLNYTTTAFFTNASVPMGPWSHSRKCSVYIAAYHKN